MKLPRLDFHGKDFLRGNLAELPLTVRLSLYLWLTGEGKHVIIEFFVCETMSLIAGISGTISVACHKKILLTAI